MAALADQPHEKALLVPCETRIVPVASARDEESALFQLALFIRLAPPIIIVMGDSTSCLDALYRRLPEAVLHAVVPASTPEQRTRSRPPMPSNARKRRSTKHTKRATHLVTHNASILGYTLCLKHCLWIAFQASKLDTVTTPSQQDLQDGDALVVDTNSKQGASTEGEATMKRTLCTIKDAVKIPTFKRRSQFCHWVVPRFLFRVHDLLLLLKGWLRSHRFVQTSCRQHTTFVLLINTDLTEEPLMQVQVRHRLMVRGDSFVKTAHHWARFGSGVDEVIAMYGAFYSSLADRNARGGRAASAATLKWLKGYFPAVVLDSTNVTPFSGQDTLTRKRTILNFYPRCLPLPLSRVAPDPVEWGLRQILRALSPSRGVATGMVVGADMTECCLYADTRSIAVAARRLAHANRIAAMTLQNVHDSRLFLNGGDAARRLPSSPMRRVPSRSDLTAGYEDARTETSPLHSYAPIVISVCPVITSPAELGHVYVFEFDPNLTKFTKHKSHGRVEESFCAMDEMEDRVKYKTAGSAHKMRVRNLAFITRCYLQRGTLSAARQLTLRAQLYARLLLGDKCRMTWGMTSHVERRLRFAVCATLPSATSLHTKLVRFLHRLWPRGGFNESARPHLAHLRALCRNDACSELYPLLSTLVQLRWLGWKLIFHQDLAAYVDARCDGDQQAANGDEECRSPRHDSAVVEWATARTNSSNTGVSTAYVPIAPCPINAGTVGRRHLALAQRGLASSPMVNALERQLRQAEFVTESNMLHLHVGLRVVLAGRYRGVVTGFRALTYALLKQNLFFVNLSRASSKLQAVSLQACCQDAFGRRCLLYSPPHPSFMTWWQRQQASCLAHGGTASTTTRATAALWPLFLPQYMEDMETLLWPEVTLDTERTVSVLVLPNEVHSFTSRGNTSQATLYKTRDAASNKASSPSRPPSLLATGATHSAPVQRVTTLTLPLQLSKSVAVTTLYLTRAAPMWYDAGVSPLVSSKGRLTHAKWHALHQRDMRYIQHSLLSQRRDSVMLLRCHYAPRYLDLTSFTSQQRRLRCALACTTRFHCLVK